MSSTLHIKVEFGGGLELLFGNQRIHNVELPSYVDSSKKIYSTNNSDVEQEQRHSNVSFLLHWLKGNLLKEREELFMEGDSVRPGILVLINDSDWELEGEGDYVLKDGDEVVLISTLHGG